jgi:hypothetical protein
VDSKTDVYEQFTLSRLCAAKRLPAIAANCVAVTSVMRPDRSAGSQERAMRQSVMLAFACGAIAAVFAGEPAAAANAWGGSYCLGYAEGGKDCGFTSLAQCQASASGTLDGCYARPGVAVHQGGSVQLAAPAQDRRGAARSGQ